MPDRTSNYRCIRVLVYPLRDRTMVNVLARAVNQGSGRDRQLINFYLDADPEVDTVAATLRAAAAALEEAAVQVGRTPGR